MLLVLVLLLALAGARAECVDRYPHALDVGIYWARTSNYAVRLEKSCPSTNETSRHYNPRKPSFIITHGAQPDAVRTNATRFGHQEGFDALIYLWLARGWNVGIFQWTQFADEPIRNFERAQAKIWSTRYFRNMEYTYTGPDDPPGTVHVGEAPIDRTVAEIFADEILAHGITRVRLAGHSLGSQLVVNTAWRLHELGADIVTRVALLDPVFSSLPQGFLLSSPYGRFIVDAIGMRMRELSSVVFEIYHTSDLNVCIRSVTATPEMLANAAYAHIVATQWGEEQAGNCYNSDLWGDPANLRSNLSKLQVQLINQHAFVVRWYLESIHAPPMRCHLSDSPSVPGAVYCLRDDALALSAAMPDQQVAALIAAWNASDVRASMLYFRQFDNHDRSESASTITPTPADDIFYVASWKRE